MEFARGEFSFDLHKHRVLEWGILVPRLAFLFLRNKSRHVVEMIAHFLAGGRTILLLDSLQDALVLRAGFLWNALDGHSSQDPLL